MFNYHKLDSVYLNITFPASYHIFLPIHKIRSTAFFLGKYSHNFFR